MIPQHRYRRLTQEASASYSYSGYSWKLLMRNLSRQNLGKLMCRRNDAEEPGTRAEADVSAPRACRAHAARGIDLHIIDRFCPTSRGLANRAPVHRKLISIPDAGTANQNAQSRGSQMRAVDGVTFAALLPSTFRPARSGKLLDLPFCLLDGEGDPCSRIEPSHHPSASGSPPCGWEVEVVRP